MEQPRNPSIESTSSSGSADSNAPLVKQREYDVTNEKYLRNTSQHKVVPTRSRTMLAVIGFGICQILTWSFLGVAYAVVSARTDELNLEMEITANKIKQVQVCIPCAELKMIPVDGKNSPDDLDKSVNGKGLEICCSRTPAQHEVLLNLLFEKNNMEACKKSGKENVFSVKCSNTKYLKSAESTTCSHLVRDSQAHKASGYMAIKDWHPSSDFQNMKVVDGQVTIDSPGLYYLYSQVHFLNVHSHSMTRDYPIKMQHKIMRSHPRLPELGMEELAHGARSDCWNSKRNLTHHTSFMGVIISMEKDDTVYVEVSHADKVTNEHQMSYFGLYKIS